jgi:SagB-type dehydrogenase family enzyme
LSQYAELTVEQAILERKSIRDYLNGSIPLSVLQDILTDSTNIDYLVGNYSEVDIRVVAGQVENLSNGTYHYQPENDSLDLISSGDQRSSLKTAGLGQDWIESAQLDIVMSVNTTWIHQQTDSTFYDKIMMFNIGMIAQNVYLKCAAHGLGTVAIGAFYENDVSQVVENLDGFKPIYIMPIGLTSEFFERTETYQIAMTELARIAGIIVFVPFYCSLYFSIPVVRRRMPKKIRWLHCLFGVIPLLMLIIHSMILHGHARSIWDFFNVESWENAIFHWVSGILTIPQTVYDLGQFAAYLCVPVILVATISGAGPITKRKNIRKIHKPSAFVSLALLLIHTTMNGTHFIRNPVIFLFFNAIAIGFYLFLWQYPNLVHNYKEENSSMAS